MTWRVERSSGTSQTSNRDAYATTIAKDHVVDVDNGWGVRACSPLSFIGASNTLQASFLIGITIWSAEKVMRRRMYKIYRFVGVNRSWECTRTFPVAVSIASS